MDVSDTKVSLHLADAGSEVTKRTVEQTEEGEGEKKKKQQPGSKYLHLHLTFQAFSRRRAEEETLSLKRGSAAEGMSYIKKKKKNEKGFV